jgi:ubiquinone/menaquinone biosynthesis C-methylase UbiE
MPMSIEFAQLVGPSGQVIGVDSDEQALAAARDLIRQSGARNMTRRYRNYGCLGPDATLCRVCRLRC